MSALSAYFLSRQDFRQPKAIRYAWDQWAYTDYFYFTSPNLLARAGKLTGTGCRALCIGLGEWIATRLSSASRIDDARDYFDAAWTSMLTPNAVEYAELAHDEWAGPDNGVLRAAMLVVNDTVFEAEEDRRFADRVCWQVHLAQYIADSQDAPGLTEWLDFAWASLEEHHVGPVVSYRSVFDPHFSYGTPVGPTELVPSVSRLLPDALRDLIDHVNRQIGRNRYLRVRTPLPSV
ncbi:MAG: hypothetical protein JNK19_17265 [Tabrizicola sp.]|nr:hypothetical protein [Tabrizicola sp.]